MPPATGTATISIITNVTSRALALGLAPDGSTTINFTGLPWYSDQCLRATNATFTGTLQTWPVQAWADGSIYVWDNFADLTTKPPQAFKCPVNDWMGEACAADYCLCDHHCDPTKLGFSGVFDETPDRAHSGEEGRWSS